MSLGRPIESIVLRNSLNMCVGLTNHGARITSFMVPDPSGNLVNVVLGYGSNAMYVGATVGRFANRIDKGRFSLDGISYALECNQPPNHLHGGSKGLHSVIWDILHVDRQSVVFRHLATEKLDGYPGDLLVEISFTLNDEGALRIDYRAETDKPTILNLTNHAYFNLSGAGSGSVAKHQIAIFADSFTPVTPSMIPTGDVRSVVGTPFDFRVAKPMGMSWDDPDDQIQIAGGFDHNFVLRKTGTTEPELAARVTDPVSGRVLEVETTQPAVQFYTANDMSRNAFCLETQHYPDSPNQPHFPSVRLDPGQIFRSTTTYRITGSCLAL